MLLDDPNQAAATIDLELEPVEQTMLQAFPKEHLAAVIDRTEVPLTQRRAFFGATAAAMLAILTGSQSVSAQVVSEGVRPDVPPGPQPAGIRPDGQYLPSLGIRPDTPYVTRGIQPDMPMPPPQPKPSMPSERLHDISDGVRRLVSEKTKTPLQNVKATTPITFPDTEFAEFRKEIYRRFDVRMPIKTLKTLKTVKLLTDYIVESLEGYEEPPVHPLTDDRTQNPPFAFGMQYTR